MSFAYTILPGLRLLCIRAVGVVTQPERIQTMRAWLADPAYLECDDAVCDFSEAEGTPTMAELRELVTLMTQRLPDRGPRKLAVVASKAITYVVAGEFRDFVEQAAVQMEIRVFPDFESGWKWLRPEEAATEPITTAAMPPRQRRPASSPLRVRHSKHTVDRLLRLRDVMETTSG